MLRVNIKKLHQNAVIPTYAKPGDAGMDLIAISKQYDEFDNVVYGTGIAIEIPENYVGLIYPRSSICKKDLYLTNHVGVIDSGYRGERTDCYNAVSANSIYGSRRFNRYRKR
jgi:dUTP pyrophosphatase